MLELTMRVCVTCLYEALRESEQTLRSLTPLSPSGLSPRERPRSLLLILPVLTERGLRPGAPPRSRGGTGLYVPQSAVSPEVGPFARSLKRQKNPTHQVAVKGK